MAIDFTKLASKGAYKRSTISVDTEVTMLDDQQVIGLQRGLTVYFHSTKAGTMKFYFIDRENNDVQLQSSGIVAGTLSVVDFDYHIPRYKITFERDDAVGDSTTWCEVFAYGAAG